MEKLLTTKEAAGYIGVKRGTLEKWRLKKTGPDYVQISGRCVRYHPEDLVSWVNSKTVDPVNPSGDTPQTAAITEIDADAGIEPI